MNETVPDALSGPAARVSVKLLPAAATQLVLLELKSASARLSWPPLGGAIEIAPSAAVIVMSVSCKVSSEPSWLALSAVLTPVTAVEETSKLATVVLNNVPSETVMLLPETSTWSSVSVERPVTPANDQSLISFPVGPVLYLNPIPDPDAVSGPASRLSVNESPTAA